MVCVCVQGLLYYIVVMVCVCIFKRRNAICGCLKSIIQYFCKYGNTHFDFNKQLDSYPWAPGLNVA